MVCMYVCVTNEAMNGFCIQLLLHTCHSYLNNMVSCVVFDDANVV